MERSSPNINIKENNQPQKPQTNQLEQRKYTDNINTLPQNNLRNVPRNPPAREENKLLETILEWASMLAAIVTFPFSCLFTFVVVQHYQRAVIFRNGRIYKRYAFGPGLVFHLPCVDTLTIIDLRTICYDVPQQEAITKDSMSVSVDAVVYYKIDDPVSAVINVTDYSESTQFLAATTLRNALGTRVLPDILRKRPAVGQQVFQLMKSLTKDWGVQVVRIEIKDISLPPELQRGMAAEAETKRLANAKIIVAEAEIEATKNLQRATEMLMDNPYCMQLRYLQSLQGIAGDETHTIVFPFPVHALQSIFNK